MSVPLTIAGFPDLLDPRFREITDGAYAEVPDMISDFYTMATPTQLTERGSALTGMGLYSEFQGILGYDGPSQGYDWSSTVKQYALAIAIERLLVEYDQFGLIDKSFKLLGKSAQETRQIEAAQTFINSFVLDPGYTHTEGVALCSDSHTSPRADVSTATGFDNLTTAPFSPLALKAVKIQFQKLRQDNGQPIDNHRPTMILGPVDLEDRADEVFGTLKGLDDNNLNKNVLANRYTYKSWIRLTDPNDWWAVNTDMMKDSLTWFDKWKPEFARVEDFDTMVAKYRGWYASHRARSDWRFIVGANVT